VIPHRLRHLNETAIVKQRIRLRQKRRDFRLIVTCDDDHLVDTGVAQDAKTAKNQRLSLNLNRPLCAAPQPRALSCRKQHRTNPQSPGLAVAGLAADFPSHSRASIISRPPN
jgi:hypothetical protein